MYNVDKKEAKEQRQEKDDEEQCCKEDQEIFMIFSTTIAQESVNKTMKGRIHKNA